MRPIAITSTFARAADGSVDKSVLAYTRAVERAGAPWTLVPNDPASIDGVLATHGGLLVTGGVDIDPERYGGRQEHANAETREYSADRDAFEIALVRAARDRNVPLLAICRGLQVVNVAFGGTLMEDVREELGDAYTIEHRQTHESGLARTDYARGHAVDVEPGSRFAAIAGSTRFATNSMHHQAVRVVGDGLRAVGRTADGIVEVLDPAFDHTYFVAVQWHPEELADDAVSARLFGGLLAAARTTSPG